MKRCSQKNELFFCLVAFGNIGATKIRQKNCRKSFATAKESDRILDVVLANRATEKEWRRKVYFMISFIIYAKNEKVREVSTKVIKKFLYTTDDYYKIYELETYNLDIQDKLEHIQGVRIYILDLDNSSYDACEIARKIRCNGDFVSPIILLTKKDKSLVIENLSNILYSDLLKIDERLIFSLMRSLKSAYNIITRYAVYSFLTYDEIYRIPYNDIYMICKNFKEDSVTIYTKDDTYLNYITIKGVEDVLCNDPRFLKIHRSCIVNIHKVVSYDRKSGTLVFNNGLKTNRIAKSRKAILYSKLKECCIIDADEKVK